MSSATTARYLQKIEQLRKGGYDGPLGIGLQGHFETKVANFPYIRAAIDIFHTTTYPFWVTRVRRIWPSTNAISTDGKAEDGKADDAELLTNTLNICAGHREEILSHNDYKTLSSLTTKICHQLSLIQTQKEMGGDGHIAAIKNKELEQDMQLLVKLVLEKSGGINRNIKKTFMAVAKTYYYRAYHAADTIDTHMFKVLFEPVE